MGHHSHVRHTRVFPRYQGKRILCNVMEEAGFEPQTCTLGQAVLLCDAAWMEGRRGL